MLNARTWQPAFIIASIILDASASHCEASSICTTSQPGEGCLMSVPGTLTDLHSPRSSASSTTSSERRDTILSSPSIGPE
ncbi:MAG: hypothetical protein A4E31_00767 [Methanomassiliicoccales archaeon PtaU1.Bin030]|nr:MAG: hypothetical protein A4E31_00767 [Methanomassiliicoccales archaeon PtaU1.Bin030]